MDGIPLRIMLRRYPMSTAAEGGTQYRFEDWDFSILEFMMNQIKIISFTFTSKLITW